MRCNRFLAGFLVTLMFSVCAFPAQKPAEVTASVPELTAFHAVIYKIWHEAWPSKDAALLRKLLPEVEQGIANVASAQLPGILRDKKAAWDKGVQDVQAAAAEYKTAVSGQDDAKLLKAAEKLHACFERLMRAIRPPLKELDELHAVLYMLYHHYLPDRQTAQIKTSSAELAQKMAVLNQVKLPERLKSKEAAFQSARGLLSDAVRALEKIASTGDAKAVHDAVEAVHTNYQKLEKILE